MAIDSAFLRSIDWSRTAVGPMETWPVSLRSYVQMILALPTPAIVFWGRELVQIYNDGYATILGPRHPRGMGQTYAECWPETYPRIGPWMKKVLHEGQPTEVARAHIEMARPGFTEETYFTFTLSPIFDDEGKIAGVYQPVVEMTESVLRERRSETLRVLTANKDVLGKAAAAFAANRHDIPFAAIYLDGKMASSVGFLSDDARAKALDPLETAIAKAQQDNAAALVSITPTAAEPWPEPVHSIFLTPIRRADADQPFGVIAFGVSPRLDFDDEYREFFWATAREIATNLATARAEETAREWLEREQAARREADLARQQHGQRLAMLFEHAPVGIAVLRGPDHVFEAANSLCAALVGNRKLLQLSIREALPELEGQGLYELLDRVYTTREPFLGRSVPITVTNAEGVAEARFFDFGYQPLPGSDGEPDAIIVAVFDVTELSRARSDAESASRTKDEFFAILGHELRNPLAPITTALELMKLRGDDALTEERALIERHVAQITRLVDDLLDVSRITRGKVNLKVAPIEIGDVVKHAVEMASPLLEQRQHELSIDAPAHGLMVDGDANRLAQVISNLLSNAAKYTEGRGHLRVRATGEGDDVVVRVSDDGIGIGAGMLGRVFEPFAQDHQSLDRSLGGLGLGLTIVANLVKLHGGSVIAESAGRDQGSTFTVRLPRSQATIGDAHAASALPVADATAPSSLRVLVVDDNEDAAELLAEAIGMLGYDTKVAHDGAEALRLAAETTFDVALLDIGLPVMDGYELARRLRSSGGGDRLRLVAVTGYGQDADRARAASAGFDAHLVKPVQLDTIADLIASYAS